MSDTNESVAHPEAPMSSPALIHSVPRLYVREPGWRVVMKGGSEREHCYSFEPGQDYYHRFSDGEIFLQRADEKYCLPCSARLGLLYQEPKPLRGSPVDLDIVPGDQSEIPLA